MTAPENAHGMQPMGSSSLHTAHQPQGNTSSGSFITFDPNKFISKQTRALGVIQILLGLIHVFSAIKPWLYYWTNPLARLGYPIWGGISFIISGSVSVYAVKNPSLIMMKRNLLCNIISTTNALIGICIVISEVFLITDFRAMFPVSLLPFTVLEFCLSCVVSVMGYRALRCKKDMNTVPHPISVNVS